MGLVATITPQETFPATDLSKENAGWLELILAHSGTLDIIHDSSRTTQLCRLGHAAIREAGSSLESVNGDTASAFDLGIRTYEAVSACVNPRPPERSLSVITEAILEIAQAGMDNSTLCDYIDEASKLFRAKHPNTLQTVSEVAQRFYAGSAAYSTYGAALACQLERRVAGAR
jgi:hypothetical protein